MILKASTRGGARQLARHLLRTDENDHVEVAQLRGFVSSDLLGALTEAQAVAKGTRCKQFLFSLSLNPPLDSGATLDDLTAAVGRAEVAVGLVGQPRAIVIHEKLGRRHAHAVWSRINPATLKAVPMPFFKTRLAALSKELYLDHQWALPEGHKENGWHNPQNFSLGEWQQAKRLDLDPRELRQLFRTAWAQSDNLASFRQALADRGYFLARGDRRGFVAVDVRGEVFSVARMVGLRTKEITARLGSPDALPNVAEVTGKVRRALGSNVHAVMQEARRSDRLELAPLRAERRAGICAQRRQRQAIAETHERAQSSVRRNRVSRLRRSSSRLPSLVGERGHTAAPEATSKSADHGAACEPFIRAQYPGEDYVAYMNYRRACEGMFEAQLDERRAAQQRLDEALREQRARRMALMARMAGLVEPPGARRLLGRRPW